MHSYQLLLGAYEEDLGSCRGLQRRRYKGEVPFIHVGGLRLADQSTSQVQFYDDQGLHWQIWKLIPVVVEPMSKLPQSSFGTLGSGSPPLYDGDVTGQPSTHIQHNANSEHNDFGTTVTEVTTVITTTRRKYHVEDT